MEQFPGRALDEGVKEEQDLSTARDRRLANAAIVAKSNDGSAMKSMGGEVSKGDSKGVDVVRDHFPEFKHDYESNSLETEEDYKKAFDLFEQIELIPIPKGNNEYDTKKTCRPYKETVHTYLKKTKDTIRDLTGESGKLPKTDVAIYLDKSARPVSWFVDELWENVTKEPRPETAHLAIDRTIWFRHFGVELGFGEYIKGTNELATWRDLPIHEVKKEEIMDLCNLLRDGIITHDEINAIILGNGSMVDRIKGRSIDAIFKKEDVLGRVERGELTKASEIEGYKTLGIERANKVIASREKLKNTYDAFMIAMQLRGLFVPGGLSEEDVKNPERIMGYEVGMEGKNITIIDEVERSGATGEIAKHFVSWAFPEAANVNFYVFYKARRLADSHSPQYGQMLMIPFWYSLEHDDGLGRGIGDIDKEFYEEYYEENPDDLRRAMRFGSGLLGTPIEYEEEEEKRSLRLREQIARAGGLLG